MKSNFIVESEIKMEEAVVAEISVNKTERTHFKVKTSIFIHAFSNCCTSVAW